MAVEALRLTLGAAPGIVPAMEARHDARPYAFGDGDRAALRLRLLAEAFAPATAGFLREVAPRRPELAIDLGCGPGHTTALIATTLVPARVVGLDRSADFVARATAERAGGAGGSAVSFISHDVTELPLPAAPANLLFARYLLAHLPDAEALVAAWATQLRPRGSLLLEEVERIDTEVPAFTTYLDAAAALLRDNGTELYVGERLDRVAAPPGTARVDSRQATIAPSTATAARIFALNLEVWRNTPSALARRGAASLDELAEALAMLERSSAAGEIVWTHRQLAFERTG